MIDRASEADEPPLVKDPDQRAKLEAQNALAQFDDAAVLLRHWIQNPLRRLKPSDVLALHRTLMESLSEYAGIYRPAKIKIRGSRHRPPPAHEVPGLVEDMCDYISSNWDTKTSVHLSAYVLWRINWIHPFSDGNGRTARVVANLILCSHARKELPGDLTIPEQIARNKKPYYKALEAADFELKKGRIDLSALENLLNSLLANQLYDFYRKISGDNRGIEDVPPEELSQALKQAELQGAEDREAVLSRPDERKGILAFIESHPALSSIVGALIAAIVAWLLPKIL